MSDVLRVTEAPEGAAFVRLLTLHRPERRNALSPELLDALLEALRAADDDDAVRAVVITGAGDKAFCAGGDLSGGVHGEALSMRARLGQHEERGRFAELLTTLRRMKTTTLAAVNGMALGGGLGIMLGCDFAVAAEGALLGTPEVKRGLFPMMIARLLYEQLPAKTANALVLLGETLTGARAAELQLVNSAVPLEAVVTTTIELASKIARLSPAVLGLGKRAVQRQRDMGFEDALAFLRDQLTLNLQLDDAAEGIAAFLEKRDPSFTGR